MPERRFRLTLFLEPYHLKSVGFANEKEEGFPNKQSPMRSLSTSGCALPHFHAEFLLLTCRTPLANAYLHVYSPPSLSFLSSLFFAPHLKSRILGKAIALHPGGLRVLICSTFGCVLVTYVASGLVE